MESEARVLTHPGFAHFKRSKERGSRAKGKKAEKVELWQVF
jgi:hypothetical protein